MDKISTYMYGNRGFVEKYVSKNDQKLIELATKGQKPQALFIGCVDSRVLPNLITDTGPGEMLVLRNVGNFVPPHDEKGCENSVASALEFAIKVLKVNEIIVCGHTQCGAIYTIFSDLDVNTFPSLSAWLKQGEKLRTYIDQTGMVFETKEAMLRKAEEMSVKLQLENLLTYPFVQEAIQNNEIELHGWIYNIQTGKISSYDRSQDRFVSIDEVDSGGGR